MTRVKWIKLAIDMFDDEKIKIIDSMAERNLIHYVWIRLLVQAGKTNSKGDIFLNENIPYTKEILSIIFNRSIKDIELSLKVLSDLRMIEIDENNFINILNWEKHQNIEGMEKIREETRKRVQNHRNKKKIEKDTKYIKEAKDAKDIENTKYIKETKDIEDTKDAEDNSTSKDDEDNINNTLVTKEKTTIINDTNNHENYNKKLETLCNVTVTEQSKRENKKEIKNKTKKETKNITVCLDEVDFNKNKKYYNNEFDTKESEVYKILNPGKNKEDNVLIHKEFALKDDVKSEDVSEEAIEKYIKKLGVNIIGGNMPAIKLAVSIHGGANVKLAIEKSLEVNKPRMNYINGILTNWKREGYPSNVLNSNKVQEKIINSHNNTKVLSFNDFEPRKYDYDALEKALLGW